MRSPYGSYEVPKEVAEVKYEETEEVKKVETNGKNVEELNEEAEFSRLAIEELETEYIMKGVGIKESEVNPKLGKELNKFIQLFAHNPIDSILKTKP